MDSLSLEQVAPGYILRALLRWTQQPWTSMKETRVGDGGIVLVNVIFDFWYMVESTLWDMGMAMPPN